MKPKFPNARVQLSNEDGNAFTIIGRTLAAMNKAGATQDDLDEFSKEATSGDYDHMLQTVMRTVNVDGEDEDEDVA